MTLADIDLANRLAHEVLGHSLDELQPQTRYLLRLIDEMVKERCVEAQILRQDCRFTRRDIREFSGWGATQLSIHLKRLETLEYLLRHRGGKGQQIVYELLYSSKGNENQTFMMGLIETERLKKPEATENKSVLNANLPGANRGHFGTFSGGSRGSHKRRKNNNNNELTVSLDDKPVITGTGTPFSSGNRNHSSTYPAIR